MTLRLVIAAALLAASGLGRVRPLAAQTDVIRGRVTSASAGDMPIEGASITATTLTGGVNRSARTDRNGRYTITFPGAEGDYFVTVIAIGYVPRRFEVKRTADQDILIADTRLTLSASTLDTIVTVGRRDRPLRADTLADIGGMDRIVNTTNVAVEQLGDLAAMAASTPGLIYIAGVDGDPSGYVALGLEQSQNGLTINGMNSTSSNLPRDGSYSVTVSLSPYDVSQGQFSGGRTNVRVNSGSNYINRVSSVVFNAPALEWTDRVGRALGQRYTNANIGGGVSGPISFDKAFYSLSYQLGRRANDLHTLLNTDALGLQTSGIASDSVQRLAWYSRELPHSVDRQSFPNRSAVGSRAASRKRDVPPAVVEQRSGVQHDRERRLEQDLARIIAHVGVARVRVQYHELECDGAGKPYKLLRFWHTERKWRRAVEVAPIHHAVPRAAGRKRRRQLRLWRWVEQRQIDRLRRNASKRPYRDQLR